MYDCTGWDAQGAALKSVEYRPMLRYYKEQPEKLLCDVMMAAYVPTGEPGPDMWSEMNSFER
jgi:hypothetical protein